MKEMKIQCIICKGKGKIDVPQLKFVQLDKETKNRTIKGLRESGFSYKEIMSLTGLSSPRSVYRKRD